MPMQWREESAALRAKGVEQLNAFLRRVRGHVDAIQAPARPVHVFLGNEAADADSIVSSLVYAYLRDHQSQSETVLAVPVLSIPRDELPLRCDVMALFEALGIDTSAMVFVDEFPWEQASSSLRLTLLDHNALTTKRMPSASESLGDCVVEILDHHADLGVHASAAVRDIAFHGHDALVASTCTLVAERLLASDKLPHEHHALSATLLLAVIALDSINFDPRAKKVTPRDVAAAAELERMAFADKAVLFHWLHSEKFNVAHWSAFSPRNCLQCDYKEFDANGQRYGVSAVLIPLQAFVRKAETPQALTTALRHWCDVNGLAFLVVMTMTMDPGDGSRHRQILFFEDSETPRFVPHCLQALAHDDVLQLESLALPVETTPGTCFHAFSQRNTAASRKQVVPLLQQALSKL
ncbi:hypothetical protein P43SY_009764 [Pythium insidiosum]|uniref:DHHA2 domain-containing protein n=1 Tax=Pythium insidiosum TaxID=114742 RepID=A0AAD5LQ73_PYTIN|nr:hypothetical protein P43SY_009764 [Pythium insidiosum]